MTSTSPTSPAGKLPDEAAAAPQSARFGKFVRTKKLGAGGMGEVWKALKFLKGGNEEELARFQREAQTAARLQHPNIAAIHDVGEDQDRHFIAMQFVEGQTLRTVPRVDRRHLAGLVRDAARAVAFANEHGVIHRDLKPDNIMVGGDQHVFVMDFGLAKSVEGDPGGTEGRKGEAKLSISGMVVGTPAYMPPEQARGEKVDARADVYGLGATLYELLTDRPSVRGENVFDILVNVQSEEPKSPRRIDASIDADLETIVMKCLEKEPGRRYATAGALADDLDRWLEGEAISARPASIAYRIRKRLAKKKAVVALALVAVAALGAGILYGLAQRSRAADLEQRVAVKVERAREMVRKAQAMAYREDFPAEDWKAKLAEAERACREVIGEYASHAPAHLVLGLIAMERDELDAAVASFGLAVKHNPAYEQAYRERAKAYAETALREEHDQFVGMDDAPEAPPEIRQLALAALADIGRANLSGIEKGERVVLELLSRLLRAGPEGIAQAVEAYATEPGFDERAWRIAAEAEHRATRYRRAASFAEKYAAIRRGDAVAWSRLGHLMHDARLKGAVEACDRAIRLRGDYAEAWYNRGRAGRETVDFDRAIELRPGYAHALLARSLRRDAAGDVAGARADLDGLLAATPDHALALCNRGNLKMKLGDREGGEADFDRAIRSSPRSELVLSNRSLARFRRGDTADASVAANPGFARAYYVRAHVKTKTGDHAGARRDYDVLVVIDGRRAEPWVARAALRNLIGDRPGAIADCDTALQLSPDHADALSTRGMIRVILDEAATGLADLERAIALGDSSLPTAFSRGNALQKLGRHREALVVYDAVIGKEPADARYYNNRAASRRLTGDRRGAREDCETAIALDPKLPGSYVERAILRQEGGDLKLALEDVDLAIRLAPQMAQAHYWRGALKARGGAHRESLADFDRAIVLEPTYAGAYTDRGIARSMVGDAKGGMADFDSAVDLDPRSPLYRMNRAIGREKAGDLKGAIADLEKTLELAPKDWPRRPGVEFTLERLRKERK